MFMVVKILFVCSGNTCRSPMAEGLFRILLREKLGQEASEFKVSSAGLSALEGHGAFDHAVEAAREEGADISSHRARALTRGMIEESDLVLVMTERHLEQIRERWPGILTEKVHTLKGFVDSEGDVEDPVGLTVEQYRATIKEIKGCLERVLEKVARKSPCDG